nr:MAG TPA: hypothetical protein [Caudoviricetes sp.]
MVILNGYIWKRTSIQYDYNHGLRLFLFKSVYQ